MNADDYVAFQAGTMTENQLQAVIIANAKRSGWLVYHTFDSRRSQAGYPDLHLVHPVLKISLLRELKTQKGTLRPEQKTWITALEAAGLNIAIWRPVDWFNGSITAELAPGTERPGF